MNVITVDPHCPWLRYLWARLIANICKPHIDAHDAFFISARAERAKMWASWCGHSRLRSNKVMLSAFLLYFSCHKHPFCNLFGAQCFCSLVHLLLVMSLFKTARTQCWGAGQCSPGQEGWDMPCGESVCLRSFLQAWATELVAVCSLLMNQQ